MLDTSPTKVIQIGDNAHNRVAQACDRCRRKKIRCDGKRPCCTQCANVGFECVTSDKLSRRAFPRGYTESLEAKVRSLQSELGQLREIAEKPRNGSSVVITSESKDQSGEERIETCILKSIPELGESSPLNNAERSPSTGSLNMVPASPTVEVKPYRYRGLSSIGGLVDVFKYQHKSKIRLELTPTSSTSRSELHYSREDLIAKPAADSSTLSSETQGKLIDKYFEEWNPLFPILDKADVETYSEDTNTALKTRQDKGRLALKYLVLSVGSLSGAQPAQRGSFPYELVWRDTLSSMMGSDELLTLQCLLLAQLFCIYRSDTAGLLHYQNSAVALVFRLALHLSQNDEPISVAIRELRKRLFWTQYTIHCFSSACLGQSVLVEESDIRCEYPSAAEVRIYGDGTSQKDRINQFAGNAPSLALFKLARILSRVLRENYSVFGAYSETKLGGMSKVEELNSWLSDFKVNFCHDRHMGNITNRNTLILRVTYHYVSTLLHRPTMICCSEANKSLSNFGESCKSLVQDLRQLNQENKVFAMCIRSEDLLLIAGIGLLMQRSSPLVSRTSKSEFQALTKAALEMVESRGSQRASELSHLMELTKPRSSLKRSNSSATQEDPLDGQITGRNKIRKTQKAINTVTSFDTPEITTPIKVEYAVPSNNYMNNLDTKSPLKSTMRRISTVQSEPSYSPIRSSPVKRISRNVRHDTTQSYDLDLASNTCSRQSMQSWIRAPPSEVNSLRVDVSTAQWARAGSFVATPSDHSSAAISASFNHNHDYSFYNNTYDNNSNSVPHVNNIPFDGSDDFTNADANIHPNSHIHVQHSHVNNINATNIDMPLITPTDDCGPSWNTPSVWDGSPAQSQIPVSTMTSNCCNRVNSSHTGTEMSINARMNNLYTSHQVEQHQNQTPHHHHHHHHPALVDVREEYSQTGNYVPVPTVLPAGDGVAADSTYQQSVMMAAAASGAYGHLHTPP